MDPWTLPRTLVVRDIERQVGRHDQAAIYDGPPGDPGLVGGPDSVSWRLNGDVGAVAIAGAAAIFMEVLHPSVMAGVQDQSTYQQDPYRRARTTFGYVAATTFGSTAAARKVIERVRRMHARVNGTRPDGVAYHALDPALIAWVHTCIPWAIMTAYDRFTRPLSVEEKDRYLAEQAVVGLLGGAEQVPTSVAELEALVAEVRPLLAWTEQTAAFMDFMVHSPFGGVRLPGAVPRAVTSRLTRFQLGAAMAIMPRWARELVGLDHPPLAQAVLYEVPTRAFAAQLRWAFGTPEWKAMALRRATAAPGRAAVAPIRAVVG